MSIEIWVMVGITAIAAIGVTRSIRREIKKREILSVIRRGKK